MARSSKRRINGSDARKPGIGYNRYIA